MKEEKQDKDNKGLLFKQKYWMRTLLLKVEKHETGKNIPITSTARNVAMLYPLQTPIFH